MSIKSKFKIRVTSVWRDWQARFSIDRIHRWYSDDIWPWTEKSWLKVSSFQNLSFKEIKDFVESFETHEEWFDIMKELEKYNSEKWNEYSNMEIDDILDWIWELDENEYVVEYTDNWDWNILRVIENKTWFLIKEIENYEIFHKDDEKIVLRDFDRYLDKSQFLEINLRFWTVSKEIFKYLFDIKKENELIIFLQDRETQEYVIYNRFYEKIANLEVEEWHKISNYFLKNQSNWKIFYIEDKQEWGWWFYWKVLKYFDIKMKKSFVLFRADWDSEDIYKLWVESFDEKNDEIEIDFAVNDRTFWKYEEFRLNTKNLEIKKIR